ncbi:MAG: hypothetical protein AMXMBFR66_20900 [Pseudomonadota bacterium]|nr:cysteine-rich CWC family protein [Rubrivivax sp.]
MSAADGPAARAPDVAFAPGDIAVAPVGSAAGAQALPEPLCPLCGSPNACRPAATGSLGEACWCRGVTFSPELLAAVPGPKRSIACICRACAEAASASVDRA